MGKVRKIVPSSVCLLLLFLCMVFGRTHAPRTNSRWMILENRSITPKPSSTPNGTQATSSPVGVCGQDPAYKCDDKCLKLVRLFKAESAVSNWRHRHKELIGHFKGKCKSMIEIGTARGELAAASLEHVNTLDEWHAVDPFLGGYDNNDIMSTILKSTNGNDTNPWVHAIISTEPYGCRFQLHHGMSSEVANQFKKNSMDCIFIDGDHTYEGVRLDIQLYSPFVKPGGYIFFDDYNLNFRGVLRAVQELAIANNLTMHSASSYENVYVQKPPSTVYPDIFNTHWAIPWNDTVPYVPVRPMVYPSKLPYPQEYKNDKRKEPRLYAEYFGNIKTYATSRVEVNTETTTNIRKSDANLRCPNGSQRNKRTGRCSTFV